MNWFELTVVIGTPFVWIVSRLLSFALRNQFRRLGLIAISVFLAWLAASGVALLLLNYQGVPPVVFAKILLGVSVVVWIARSSAMVVRRRKKTA